MALLGELMARKTLTPAEVLAEALQAAELGAGSEEHGTAVQVADDQARSTLVWLPCEIADEYIWGSNFQFTAPAEVGTDELVQMIKATARFW